MRILLISGTRPEAIKLAPLILYLKGFPDRYSVQVCVTAQHRGMLDQVLAAFEIAPDYDLDLMIPSQTLFQSTPRILAGLEAVFSSAQPHDAELYVRDRIERGDLAVDTHPFLDPGRKLIVVTAHRRESFGEGFERICQALSALAQRDDVQIVYPVHPNPNVQSVMNRHLRSHPNVTLVQPLAYVPFVDLLQRAFILNQKYARMYGIVPGPLRDWIRNRIATSDLFPASVRRKLGHTFVGRDNGLESLFLDNFYCAFSKSDQERMFPGTRGQVYENYMSRWNSRAEEPTLPRMLYADQKTYLVELLMKQDQMSMANSIESRVPFLDHQFVEFAMSIPDHLKVRGATQKYVLKEAVADLLPREIIHRKKMGFPTPLRGWLMDSRANSLIDGLRARDGLLANYVQEAELDNMIERHRGGLIDATDRLWRLLNLQIWGDVFLNKRSERWKQREISARPA